MATTRGETIKYGIVNMRGNQIRNVGDPIQDYDALNKRSLYKYDDLPPMPLLGAKVGGTGIPTLTAFKNNISQYTFAVNDYVYGVSELTHAYKEGTDIECHVHWATNGSEGTAKYVKWELEYSIAGNGVAFPTSVVVSNEIEIPANTADRTHLINKISTTDITGTNFEIGAYITYRFRRIAAVGAAPAANPFALAVGFHVLQDSAGSPTVYTK